MMRRAFAALVAVLALICGARASDTLFHFAVIEATTRRCACR